MYPHTASVAAGWASSTRNFIFLIESEPCWVRKLGYRGKGETNFAAFENHLFQTQRNKEPKCRRKASLMVEF